MTHPYLAVARPLVLGHRGAAGDAPENTLAAFREGLAQGAHLLESDVHLTRDGVPVLAHDARVDRVTDGRGAIAEMTLHELDSLDWGFGFTRDEGATFPFRGRGLRAPSLEEAFTSLPAARFNLELKADDPALVERTVALVQALGRESLTLVTSANDGVMKRLRDELSRTGAAPALGAGTGDVLAFVRSALGGGPPPSDVCALQIPTTFGDQPLITRELVAHAHAHDVHVHAWTINEEDEMARLLDLGVDGIVTDFPGRLARLLERRRARA